MLLGGENESYEVVCKLGYTVILGCPVGSLDQRLGSVDYTPNIPRL